MSTSRIPGRKAQRQNLIQALMSLDLADDDIAAAKLQVSIVHPIWGTVNLGRHALVDICIDVHAIAAKKGIVLGDTVKTTSLGGKDEGKRVTYWVIPTSVRLELDGEYVGYVRQDGVFIPETRDAIKFASWIEATSCRLDLGLQALRHRGQYVRVTSHEVAVILLAGWDRRMDAAHKKLQDHWDENFYTDYAAEHYGASLPACGVAVF